MTDVLLHVNFIYQVYHDALLIKKQSLALLEDSTLIDGVN